MNMHTNFYELLSESQRKVLRLIGTAASVLSVSSYLVGGSVRDLLMGVKIRDIDISVESINVREFCEFMETSFGAQILRFSEFGTCKLTLGGVIVDVAMTRSETYEPQGSLPTVKYADIDMDLARRDFSINSMAVPILPSELGSIIDPNQGLEDIRREVIRVLHPRSFVDDSTRIFRAVRYSVRLGFELENETNELLMNSVQDIGNISGTRTLNEIIRICHEPQAGNMLKKLNSVGVFKAIHPKFVLPSYFEGNCNDDCKEAWSNVEICCLLLFDSDMEYWESIAHSMDMPKAVLKALTGLEIMKNLGEQKRNSDIYQSLISVPQEALNVGIKCLDKTKSAEVKFFRDNLKGRHLSITGDDLISLGVEPGPLVGHLLDQVFAALLNGDVQGRDSELEFVKSLIA